MSEKLPTVLAIQPHGISHAALARWMVREGYAETYEEAREKVRHLVTEWDKRFAHAAAFKDKASNRR